MNRFALFYCIFFSAVTSAFAAEDSFRVVASTNSQWRERGTYDWVLHINDQPRGNLTLGHGVTEIPISPEQRKTLIDSAVANGFFSLPEQIGFKDIEAPIRNVTIVNGKKSHSVIFYDPGPLENYSKEQLQEFANLPKFLSVWATIRSFINNPRAADERKEDEKLVRSLNKRLAK
jgi:hypothetical protein